MLVVRPLKGGDALILHALLLGVVENGDDRWFHPHPMTLQEAQKACGHRGLDYYCGALDEGPDSSAVLGYGMLRGWEEGFSVPSLGIVVQKNVRGLGVGRVLVEYMHAVARIRNCEKIRLKVFPENQSAVRLYESLGYEWQTEMVEKQLVGYVKL